MTRPIDEPPVADEDADQDHPPRFWSSESHSVYTTRQFGLLRGKSLKSAPNLLHAENVRRRKNDVQSEDPTLGDVSPPSEEETTIPSTNGGQIVKNQQQSILASKIVAPPSVVQSNFGNAAKVEKYAWNWPLGNARILNTDDRFEARLPMGNFVKDEVWATVVGNELTVCLDSTDRPTGLNRFLIRTYTLPLNVYPYTAEFKILRNVFVMSVEKDRPLTLAIASYGNGQGR